MDSTNCQSCGTPFKGKFCYHCGEKQRHPSDFSISKFISGTVDVFTHFDGKFFRTAKHLLFYPGRLTADYLSGKRVKFMKPVQLYVVIAICFFILFKNWDIFYTRMQFVVLQKPNTEKPVYYQKGELNGRMLLLRNYVTDKAEKKGISFEQMVFKIDEKTPELSKAFIFLIIPLLALFLYATGFRKFPYYTQHLFHATHIFTFFLCMAIIWIGGYELMVIWTKQSMNYNIAFFPVMILLVLYTALSIKRLYGKSWIYTICSTLIFSIGALISAILYNNLITYFSVWMA